MKYRSIAFCGFMGSGKTTVSKRLSSLMGMEFADMDVYIEQKSGLNINNIFEKFGEEEFRKMEFQAAKEICRMKRVIIAAGGGTFTNSRIIKLFKETGILILYLKAPFEILYERIAESQTRPLIKQKNKAELEKLYNERCIIYEKIADIIVPAEDSPEMICRKIKKELSMQIIRKGR